MRSFRINERIEIVCEHAQGVRDGFTHVARLLLNGQEVDSARVHYLNRTWESYEYQTVANKLVERTTALNPAEKQMVKKWLAGDRTDWTGFQMTGMVAKLGDVFGQSQQEKNEWKTRMLKAGLGGQGLEIPSDWATLPEEVKQARLNKVIGFISAKGKVRSKIRKKPLSQTKSIIKQFIG